MPKAPRNKTIDFSAEEGREYIERCITPSIPQSIEQLRNKTLLGDAFELLPLMPEGFADLVIADPPYNMSKAFDSESFRKMSASEYEDYTRQWLGLVYPLLREGGSIYVCCDWESSLVIGRVLGEKFTVRSRITWQREKGRGAARNWKNGMEDIWFATKGENYTFNLDSVKCRRKVIAPYTEGGAPKDWTETAEGRFRDTCPSNFWDDISVPFWSMPENTAHPTQKPEKLLAKLILASSNEGDTVLDPFLGSGSSSVTAKKLGRCYVGIEKSERYCAFAEYRLECAERDKRIQGYENGVFYERNTKKE